MIDTVTNTAEEVFDQLIEHTLKKNVDKTLSLFDHSELFNFIDDPFFPFKTA